MIDKILNSMGLRETPVAITQLQHEEDEDFYHVWRLDFASYSRVLKKAKGQESQLYHCYFDTPRSYAPRLYATGEYDGETYLLMEYIPGYDLQKCTREDLILALDGLITMQKEHFSAEDPLETFPKSLQNRKARRHFLRDPRLERAYDAYLAEYMTMPKCLCHDDLLPFNVRISGNRAVLIDWEVGGILPYPTSLARLIAHAEETEDAFFYLKEEDRSFALDYYFQHFVKEINISRQDFDRHMALCLFYEYCEWVYVGNKYDDRGARFRAYYKKALHQAGCLGF